jgi:hypothetical protein
MSEKERAFIYASIQLRIEDEKREKSKINKARAKGGRRR